MNDWVNSSDFTFRTTDVTSKKNIYHNIRKNLSLIDKWLHPSKCHDEPAIIVSGGPSTNYKKIKKLLKKNPNTKVFCVKHSLPKLIENGIEPDFCVIVDTRTIYESSSWGEKRVDLLKTIPAKTNMIFISRSHWEYIEHCRKMTDKIYGIHLTGEEIITALNLYDDDPNYKKVAEKIKESILSFTGSCAGVLCISVTYTLGFRKMHLFGYDGDIKNLTTEDLQKTNDDGSAVYYQIKCNNKLFNTTGELYIMCTEFENLFQELYKTLNMDIKIYGEGTLISELWTKISKKDKVKLQTYTDILKDKYIKIDNIRGLINTGEIFNEPISQNDIKSLPYESYDEYFAAQQKEYRDKEYHVFTSEKCINALSILLKDTLKNVKYGLCHGSRTGKEQEWFHKYLGCDVIGTDIGYNASQKPMTIQWDFHEVKPEWIGKFDFIYSNSLDHTYDPKLCINRWMSCLNDNGILIIEMADSHGLAYLKWSKAARCKFELSGLKYLIEERCRHKIIGTSKLDIAIPVYDSKTSSKGVPILRTFVFVKKNTN